MRRRSVKGLVFVAMADTPLCINFCILVVPEGEEMVDLRHDDRRSYLEFTRDG